MTACSSASSAPSQQPPSQPPPSAADGDTIVSARFVVPAGTVVSEFDFEAQGVAAGDLSGAKIALDVIDTSHPQRSQSALCASNHPLDGCATVDYGAFGTTHDNRIAVDGPSGEVQLHLWKDRSIRLDPQPLPADE